MRTLVIGLVLLTCQVSHALVDVAVTVTVNNPTPAADEPVEFTVALSNSGPDTATAVEALIVLSPGLAIPDGSAAAPSTGNYDPDSGIWSVGDLDTTAEPTLVIPTVVTTSTPPPCLTLEASVNLDDDNETDNDRSVAAVRRDDTGRCVDVGVELWTTATDPLICGSTRRASIVLRIRNIAPDVARNVRIDFDQSPAVAPNLRFASSTLCIDGSTAASCLLAQVGPDPVFLWLTSDLFTNPQSTSFTLSISSTTTDVDFLNDNNEVAQQTGFGAFSDCAGLVPDDVGIPISPSCFIATATYGSPWEPQVVRLREFRDRFLLTNLPGQVLVEVYYSVSPPLARFIADKPALRTLTRVSLTPLVTTITYPVPVLLSLVLLMLLRLRSRQPRELPG
ncbi:MAG: DUF11 domain-containing protein [Gammaproteobacteria bacterium]|nr:DUF11 domain-containing protein [Gammaproteobacteria bacterium]